MAAIDKPFSAYLMRVMALLSNVGLPGNEDEAISKLIIKSAYQLTSDILRIFANVLHGKRRLAL